MYMYILMYVCIYIYMTIYIYLHIYIYIHIHTPKNLIPGADEKTSKTHKVSHLCCKVAGPLELAYIGLGFRV